MKWLLIIAAICWIGYYFSPIPECRQIADILDQVSENTILNTHWGFFDKTKCVFSPQEQRDKWLSNAEVFRYNAYQIPAMRRTPSSSQ